MIASTIVISIIAAFVINKFMMAKYGQWDKVCQNITRRRKQLKIQGDQNLIDKGLKGGSGSDCTVLGDFIYAAQG